MTPALTKAADKAHVLDDTIQEQLASQAAQAKKFRNSAYILLGLLILLGVIGLFRLNHSISLQNQIAAQNKKHIDCIVKLFTVPLPATAHSRAIVNPSTTCNIKVN